MKQCVTCGKTKEDTEFNFRYKDRGIRHPTCRDCHKSFRNNWYQKNKEEHLKNVHARKGVVRNLARNFVFEYLSTHPCVSCGESDPVVLEFHHMEGKDKEISVLVGGGYPVNTILSEISKCIVLCANCHRRITMNERGWFRGRR